MRQLSLGPIAWGFWSWTFQDGSCWAARCHEGGETTEESMIGWAALTMEMDMLPVVGVYVAAEHRKQGVGGQLVTTLLQSLLSSGDLVKGDAIFAANYMWERYPSIIEACGIRCLKWT